MTHLPMIIIMDSLMAFCGLCFTILLIVECLITSCGNHIRKQTESLLGSPQLSASQVIWYGFTIITWCSLRCICASCCRVLVLVSSCIFHSPPAKFIRYIHKQSKFHSRLLICNFVRNYLSAVRCYCLYFNATWWASTHTTTLGISSNRVHTY